MNWRPRITEEVGIVWVACLESDNVVDGDEVEIALRVCIPVFVLDEPVADGRCDDCACDLAPFCTCCDAVDAAEDLEVAAPPS